MPLAPGDEIDRYSILERLGTGGMGSVYRAYDGRLQRHVALKVLHVDSAEDDASAGTGGAARMLREARAAAALEHPNVIAIYDVGEAASPEALRGTPYLAMELIAGKALRAFVGDPSVKLEVRVRWLADIARALGAAHKRGLVHRDIKPANVMIRDDGVVKVLDFGIAKRSRAGVDAAASTRGETALTVTQGPLMGTPAYMAPEQLRNEPLDGRTDQFAWGVTAYELLCGKKPWVSHEDAVHLITEILTRDPVPPSTADPSIPAHVSQTVMRALSKSRDARFASMEALVGSLETSVATDATVRPGRAEARTSKPEITGADRKLLLELGRGGMGTVYLALQQRPGGFSKLKVVKQLRPELADDPHILQMFLEEARLAARLRHPNIVQTNEVGFDGTHHFIEMEYLEGQTYRALSRRSTPVSLPLAVWIFTRVLAALHYAHELKDAHGEPLHIVHRDVSPDNVMLTYDGEVKLVDFGIAKAGDSQLQTGTGVVKGKATYMAPEHLKRGRIDRRADVFAVAVMLWEAVTQKRFWAGLDEMQIFAALQSGQMPKLAKEAPDAPRALVDACDRGLAAEPGDRYATALEMESALEAYLEATGARVGGRELEKALSDAFAERRASVQKEIDAQVAAASKSGPGVVPVLGYSAEYARTRTDSAVGAAAPSAPAGNQDVPTRSASAVHLPAARETRPEGTAGVAVTGGRAGRVLGRAGMMGALLAAALVAGGGVIFARSRAGRPSVDGAHGSPSAAPPECKTSIECVRANGGEAYRCRGEDHTCVKLAAEGCTVHAEPGEIGDERTVWVGVRLRGSAQNRGAAAEDRNTIELARRDFADLPASLGGAPGTAMRRPVGVIDCSDAPDALAATKHLVEDVRVPAMIGFGTSQEAIGMLTSELVPHGAMAVLPLTASSLITSIPTPEGKPRLIWRTTNNTAQIARAISAMVADVIEPRLHREGIKTIDVALVRPNHAGGAALSDALVSSLQFNAGSVADNQTHFAEYVVDASSSHAKDAELARALVAQHPTVILTYGSDYLPRIFDPMEQSWSAGAPRPVYLGGLPMTPESLQLHERGILKRLFAITTPSNTPVNAKFVLHYNATFDPHVTLAFSPNTTYDAFYVVAYAASALDEGDATGETLAGAVRRLVGPGKKIEVGPARIIDGLAELGAGRTIDLEGAGSALDFDLASGEDPMDHVILAAGRGTDGEPIGVESGLVYDARSGKIRGAIRSP